MTVKTLETSDFEFIEFKFSENIEFQDLGYHLSNYF